jgi:hypothetical protein
LAIVDKCNICAQQAFSAVSAAPAGYTLTLFVNGLWLLRKTSDANYLAATVLSHVTTNAGPYANVAALSTALQAAASDPEPATAVFREGVKPV